jgi:PRTRC genetic system protein E
METNFFQSIVAMQVAGDWKITIAKDTTDKLVVAVLFFNDAIGDDARKAVPPILLKGTAEELDEGFFATIEQPVKETAALFANMEQYLKQRETAKLQSQMEKDKAVKAEKEKTEKQKKFDEAMKKAGELESEGKYREAWVKVPDVNDYPEQAEIIRKRKSELSAKFSPDLFQTA